MNKKRGPSDILIRLTGNNIETFINECLKQGMMLKNIMRPDNHNITFYIASTELSQLEYMAELFQCELEVVHPSLISQYKNLIIKRAGFFTGVVIFSGILIILSQMVWKIEIDGTDPEVSKTIAENLEEMGVKKGAFQFLLPSPASIQKELLNNTEGITWIGVKKKGTAYYLSVAEQTLPEKKSPPNPRHITSKKTAVIHSIYAEKGQAVVEENEVVHKGDLLISGFIGKGEYAKAVPASGEVLGETWYKVTLELPVNRRLTLLTGDVTKKYYVRLFGFKIPVWGFSSNEEFENYQVKEKGYQGSWKDYVIPAEWIVTTYEEVYNYDKAFTKKEALEQAVQAARYKMNNHLSEGAFIEKENILHSNTKDGKVKLVVHYQVIEDITSEAPIIQGDMKE